ncbi:exodeoxyribonuclease V subunit alpha [Moraxella marmotae]|uniref:exodeoxyribonuclease V subunit alpha n=1 Tax=Moraxella marmotae TaxID=3344520 RepID=UPI0035F2F96F
MTQDMIGSYVVARIRENAAWYASKNALQTPFELSKSDEQSYLLLQQTLLELLDEGHTVWQIGTQAVIDEFALANILPNWQIQCLTPTLHQLAQQASQPPDFAQMFVLIQNTIANQPKNLPTIVQQLLDNYLNLLDKNKLDDWQIEQLSARFLSVFRLYYVIATKAQTLDKFAQMLKQHRLFADILQADLPHYQAPICYYDDGANLFLWTQRAYQAELSLVRHIERISRSPAVVFALDDLPKQMNAAQVAAVKLVANQSFSIITGGPGTGKTFTVAQIVLALSRQADKSALRLGLAAPTGKAAQRMSESLQAALVDDGTTLPEPKTIHRLLGIGSQGTPKYHAQNPLPLDMIIIDEASMLGTELASQLFAAIASGCRVILLGDDHQLAAVDAGAVLADLCRIKALAHLRVHLSESRRFGDDSGVGKLAKLINQPDIIDFSDFWQLCADDAQIQFADTAGFDNLNKLYEQLSIGYQEYFYQSKKLRFAFAKLSDTQAASVVSELFDTLNQYRILSASHASAFGDEAINRFLTRIHRELLKMPPSSSPWYHGRVVMITKNLYELGLFNGDIGICLWGKSGLTVYFDGGELRSVAVDVLANADVVTAYAMTVHKSQGSEWRTVAIVFDDSNARLLSKELIYTAVTRAKMQVQIFSTQSAVVQAINTPTIRQTGLEMVARLMMVGD